MQYKTGIIKHIQKFEGNTKCTKQFKPKLNILSDHTIKTSHHLNILGWSWKVANNTDHTGTKVEIYFNFILNYLKRHCYLTNLLVTAQDKKFANKKGK